MPTLPFSHLASAALSLVETQWSHPSRLLLLCDFVKCSRCFRWTLSSFATRNLRRSTTGRSESRMTPRAPVAYRHTRILRLTHLWRRVFVGGGINQGGTVSMIV